MRAHRLRSRATKRAGAKEANGDSTEITQDLRAFDESIDTAFQLATLRGPLCAEPMTGMAFSVERLEISDDAGQCAPLLVVLDRNCCSRGGTVQSKLSQITGGLISSGQDAFRAGLLDWSPRLLLAMYSCDIQAASTCACSVSIGVLQNIAQPMSLARSMAWLQGAEVASYPKR